MRVMLVLAPTAPLMESAMFGMRAALNHTARVTDSIDPKLVPVLPGFRTDERFAATPLDAPSSASVLQAASGDRRHIARAATPGSRGLLVRGTLDPDALQAARTTAGSSGIIIYSDPPISTMADPSPSAKEPAPAPPPAQKPVCDADGARGNTVDVASRLGTGALRERGYDGHGVAVAMVDVGFNVEFLRTRGRVVRFDPYMSWVPHPLLVPGHMPVGHGTMTTYAAGIAAPEATFLDLAVIAQNTGTPFPTYLSDASQVYGTKLLAMMGLENGARPYHSLVVSNSWGVPNESFETFPPGDPGRYIDNPNHPFNLQVASLAEHGGDILFAAGNCGPECAVASCFNPNTGKMETENTIMGANGHPDVMCVAGADVNGLIAGYSAAGPGRLAHDKPDITGYTHFDGSHAENPMIPDKGTSTACPSVAGVVAAMRSVVPYAHGKPSRSPAALRKILTGRAQQPDGTAGWSPRYGFGLVNAAPLTEKELAALG